MLAVGAFDVDVNVKLDDGAYLTPLTPDDAGEVLPLQYAAFVSEAQRYNDPMILPLTQSVDDVAAELAEGGLGVREPSGRLIGAVRWSAHDLPEATTIKRLVIAPDQRRRGIGARLLAAAEVASGGTRFELITGGASPDNLAFYARAGYVEIGRVRQGQLELAHLRKDAVR